MPRESNHQSSITRTSSGKTFVFGLLALTSFGAGAGGQIINPGATLTISDVVLPGTSTDPGRNLFTWNESTLISGTGWKVGKTLTIHLYGPLNTLGVAPTDQLVGTFPGPPVTDSAGNFVAAIGIPNRIRPGNYALQAIASVPNPQVGRDTASVRINICPQTVPSEIPWSKSRGGRDGQLGDKSPERTDPEWISTWSEQPVGLYATIAETQFLTDSSQPANQPSFISHADLPYTHFAHDWNMELLPTADYLWVLATANFNDPSNHANYGRLECEWETQNNGTPAVGSYGNGNIGLPLWATPASGDRVYMVGRWAMDNGHPDSGDRTEIHPVRMLATMRQRNTAIPFPPTGCMTRASQVDVYVSGHGGGANMFPDQLSETIDNNNGSGGGRLEDVLASLSLTVYFSFGPSNSTEANFLTTYLGGDDQLIRQVAGPSGLGWLNGSEERAINDMDYDFDVPLPPPPVGATQPRVRVTQHFGHTTTVNQVITYTGLDLGTNLPTTAHIHLPYNHADNGIFAKTLNFYWDKSNPPGRHFVVQMTNITFFLPVSMSGRTYLWTEVCGQWRFLSELDPHGFLNAKATLGADLRNSAPFDVYVDPFQKVRVFTQGYDQEEFDGLFGVDVGKTAYTGAVNLANASIGAKAKDPFNQEDGENEDLGGALYERAPIPTVPFAGGILGHHTASAGLFVLEFDISYVPSPHILPDESADFGQVPIGSSMDRVVRISNAAVGLGNNDAAGNAGVDTLKISQLTFSGAGFSVVSPSFLPFDVDAGQHQDVTIRFSPTNVRQGTGTLTINSNDSCQLARVVSLSATVASPELNAVSQGNVFPPTVVGCVSSLGVTITNTGASELIVSPAVLGAGYSLSPFLGGGLDGIHISPKTAANLTVNFASAVEGHGIPGALTLTSNDPVNPTTTLNFCGDGVPTGIRVLVLQSNGMPYPSVDQIMIKGKGIAVNTTVRNVPLTINTSNCGPIEFHYETALPPNQPDRRNRLSSYTLHVKIGHKSQTMTFSLGNCDFHPIVVTL